MRTRWLVAALGALVLLLPSETARGKADPPADLRVVYFGGLGRMNDVPTNDLGVVAECDVRLSNPATGRLSRPLIRLSRWSDSGDLLIVTIPNRRRRTTRWPASGGQQFQVTYSARWRGSRFRAIFFTAGPGDVRLQRHAHLPSWNAFTLKGNPLDVPEGYVLNGRTVVDDYSVTRATVNAQDALLEWWQ